MSADDGVVEPEPGCEPEHPARDGAGTPPLRVCPNCGGSLRERSCKLVCPDPACGYFLSCSDYL